MWLQAGGAGIVIPVELVGFLLLEILSCGFSQVSQGTKASLALSNSPAMRNWGFKELGTQIVSRIVNFLVHCLNQD